MTHYSVISAQTFPRNHSSPPPFVIAAAQCSSILRHKLLMARPTHYSPVIRRDLVAATYHQARIEHTNMVELVNRLLENALRDSPGWQRAAKDWPELAAPESRDRPTG